MPDSTQQIKELQNQIADLKKLVDALVKHNHLGIDGSLEFQGETNFKGKSLTVAGGIAQGSRLVLPIAVTDGVDQDWLKPNAGQRLAASGLAITSTKGSAAEEDHYLLAVSKPGKAFSSDPSIPPNQIDWADSAQAFMRLILTPQGVVALSGPSVFGPLGFFLGERTPTVQDSHGSITQGGSTLTDSSAQFTPDSLVGSIITITDENDAVLESYIVLTNTTNVITAGNFNSLGGATLASFIQITGTYKYSVRTPILLGESGMPYYRVYVGEDIRMGYGSSGGSQVRYQKWGFGDPNGVVTANIGSVYFRWDGGANTTFYVKESGNGTSSGWVGK